MKALIPSRHLQDMTHITQAREVWENSKLIKNKSEEVVFKGAMFDVSLSEKRLFTDNGLNLTDEVKKIYCFINIILGDNIIVDGDKFEVKPILKADEIIEARKVVRQVYLDEKIEKYIVDIVFATRYPEKYDLKELKDMIGFGGSPRASINLALAARSYAFIKRRGYVIPEDVRAVAHDVLRHRIGLTYEAEASNMTSDEIVSKILNKVEVP